MHRIQKHICTLKHLLTMCFLLFALSSCAVKESVLRLMLTDYAKPTNRSQTTSQNGFCSYNAVREKKVSVDNHAKITTQKGFIFKGNLVEIGRKKNLKPYSKTFSGNSPPKYILYKRLKLHIV